MADLTANTRPARVRWRSADHLAVVSILVLMVALTAAWLVQRRYESDVASAIRKYRDWSGERSVEQSKVVAHTFRTIYESIRTIARLPGVRGIDRYASSFDANARGATQEIYNNLVSNIAVSEVYIVPLQTPPGAIDPAADERATTFDAIIVGRPSATRATDTQGSADEAESREYRLMRRQLDWFLAHHPTEGTIKGLSYPAVCGSEAIAPVHARPRSSHAGDTDPSGLVYSVPFYGKDGRIKGCISAVIPIHVLSDLLPTGDFALRHMESTLTVHSSTYGIARVYGDEIREGRRASDLIYSEVLRLPIADSTGRWILWCARSDLAFDTGSSARAAEASATAGYLGVAGIAATLLLTIHSARRAMISSRRRAEDLAGLVEARTAELQCALTAADQASRAKTDFLANMSHEIRTPMTAVMGYADLLLDPGLEPADRAQHIQTIRRQSEHLLGVINDILDISKIEAGAMTVERIPTSPIQTIEDVLSLMRVRAHQKGITLSAEYIWPLPASIQSDPVRLRQILVNLVGNAVKFTDRGGVIVRASFDAGLGSLRIDVLDSGIGISQDKLGSLFLPFTQADATMSRRFGGTGLGLAICKRLSALLGGDVSVASRAGHGSTFTLVLKTGPNDASAMCIAPPAARSSEPLPAPAVASPPADPDRVRILLAEDSIDNQRLISFHLRRAGHFVDVVGNGREAVESAMAARSAGRPFDIILMDMQMPEMDGYGAASLLRAREYTLPIIALTAHAMTGDRERCIQAGCDDHLTKPIDPQRLIEACGRWTSRLRAA